MGCTPSTPVDAKNKHKDDKKSLLANTSDHNPNAMKRTNGYSSASAKSLNTKTSATATATATAEGPLESKKQSTATPFNRAKDRVDSIKETAKFVCDGTTMRYAYYSQRGFYPDDPFKANQDSYCVHPTLSSEHRDAFFAVFDGHGEAGDGCAIFTKQQLPVHVNNSLNKTRSAMKRPDLTRDEIHQAIKTAHIDTNKALHKDSKIDDSLSGTTAISLYFHGRRNRITIANVGDSRAVLGQQPSSSSSEDNHRGADAPRLPLKVLPLSRDQTPYRKDERVRIRATGARILSLDQLEGLEPISDVSENEDDFELGEELDEDGDPPRVWHPSGDFPGTAFTRSLGDAMAEDLGVFAEPEMLTREIVPQDKIIVIASDGVFEFLTNQSVIDICTKFKDPLEACRAVVAEAHELWLQYEMRTDDITIIVMFIDSVKADTNRRSSIVAEPHLSQNFTDEIDNTVTLTSEGLRPVRTNVSKQMSKTIQKLKSTHHGGAPVQEDEFDFEKLATTKTAEEKAGIAEAIKASVMFRNITPEQREMIYACMESVHVKQGTWVIRQGTVGDRFYIIDEGLFEVRIVPEGETDESGQGGHIVHIYEGSRSKNAHPSFGELALMYSAPRSASIVAKSDGHLWALHRSAFRQVLMLQAQDNRKELKKALTEIPYFQYLDSDGINKLAAIMDEITYGRGENITEQGQVGEKMYVINKGQCYSVHMSTETTRKTLKAGNWFGDEIFENENGRYNDTVMALQTTTCWQLEAALLKHTMGPLLQGGSTISTENK